MQVTYAHYPHHAWLLLLGKHQPQAKPVQWCAHPNRVKVTCVILWESHCFDIYQLTNRQPRVKTQSILHLRWRLARQDQCQKAGTKVNIRFGL